MKKLLLACLAVATVATVNAQARFGIKAGANLSDYDLSLKGASPMANIGKKIGGYGGIVFNAPINFVWGFQADLVYAYEGTRLGLSKNFLEDIANSDYTPPFTLQGDFKKNMAASLNSHNIRLSAMITFTPGDGITVMAGPYASYRIASSARLNSNAEELLNAFSEQFLNPNFGTDLNADGLKTMAENVYDKNIKKLDVGAALGVEYAFCNGIFIEFRYNLGIMNLLEQKIDLSDVPEGMRALMGVPNADPEVDLGQTYGVTGRAKYHSINVGLGYRF